MILLPYHIPSSTQIATVLNVIYSIQFFRIILFREMEAKGGLMYESANKTIQHLSHDALPPPLSLEVLQAEDQPKE